MRPKQATNLIGRFTYLPAGEFGRACENMARQLADELLDERRGLDPESDRGPSDEFWRLWDRMDQACPSALQPGEIVWVAMARVSDLVDLISDVIKDLCPASCPSCGGRWSVRPGPHTDMAVVVVCRLCGLRAHGFTDEPEGGAE